MKLVFFVASVLFLLIAWQAPLLAQQEDKLDNRELVQDSQASENAGDTVRGLQSDTGETSRDRSESSPKSLLPRDFGMRSVPPMSLMEQRLHEASFPAEAEFRCLLASSCELGLTRGFAIGGDLGAMVGTPVFGPILEPGRWLVFDGFAGFQFLRAVDEDVYFNAGLGYRSLEHKDSDERTAEAAGMTFRVAYGQRVLDFYSQGVVLNGFYAMNKVSGVTDNFERQNSGDREFIEKFYRFTQSYPRFRLAFPADVEFLNWKNTHVDLPNHLRAYGRFEPFFVQNEFRESIEDFGQYEFIERNYGLRLSYLMSYVSSQERFGRLGFLGGVGVDFQAVEDTVSYPNRVDDYKILLPTRRTFGFYWELGGSFQF